MTEPLTAAAAAEEPARSRGPLPTSPTLTDPKTHCEGPPENGGAT